MKNIIVIVMYIIGMPFLAFAQQNLWQNISLDFNQIPTVMYYDSTINACYVTGDFTKVGDSLCNVVKLDNNGYTLMPSAPIGPSHSIIKYAGKLYLGGSGGMAYWGGQSWVVVDSVNSVADFVIHNGELWAGVYYPTDSVSLRTISKWNGTFWGNMYGSDTIIGDWTVYSIAFYKNELYIAGNINNQNHPNINEIARFDGTKWTDVGGFHASNIGDVRKLIVWRDTLYAGGLFDESSGSPGNGIAKWDGSHWHRLNDGVWQYGGPAITDLMVFHNELYACGWFYTVDGINQGIGFHGFAKWDGSRWCTLGTTANNVPFTMGQFRDSLYLMGAFDSLNNQPMKYMAKWIGGDYTDSCSQPVPAGVSEISSDNKVSLLVFPNPAQNILNVKYYNPEINSGNALITVADLLGRFILSKNIKIKQGENLWHLNTAAIPPGIYFLEINNAERKSIAKFIKQ